MKDLRTNGRRLLEWIHGRVRRRCRRRRDIPRSRRSICRDGETRPARLSAFSVSAYLDAGVAQCNQYFVGILNGRQRWKFCRAAMPGVHFTSPRSLHNITHRFSSYPEAIQLRERFHQSGLFYYPFVMPLPYSTVNVTTLHLIMQTSTFGQRRRP